MGGSSRALSAPARAAVIPMHLHHPSTAPTCPGAHSVEQLMHAADLGGENSESFSCKTYFSAKQPSQGYAGACCSRHPGVPAWLGGAPRRCARAATAPCMGAQVPVPDTSSGGAGWDYLQPQGICTPGQTASPYVLEPGDSIEAFQSLPPTLRGG